MIPDQMDTSRNASASNEIDIVDHWPGADRAPEAASAAIDWDSECLTGWADPGAWAFAGILAALGLVLAVSFSALASVW